MYQKENTNIKLWLIIFSSCFLLFACSPNKVISKKGYLLSKNKVIVDNKTISTSEINNYIQQDPNNKLLGMKLEMYIYSLSSCREDSNCNFFEKHILRALGNKPVEINNDLATLSCKNIKTYLNSHGCFNSEVHTELLPVKKWYWPWKTYKKRRKVAYILSCEQRAKVDTFIVKVQDSILNEAITKMFTPCPIKKGGWYDEGVLTTIRQKVTEAVQKRGYYDFSNKYISFQIDTLQGIEHTKIIMMVSNPENSFGDTNIVKHKPYKIKEVYFYPDFSLSNFEQNNSNYDTIKYYQKPQKDYSLIPIYFIHNSPKPFIKDKTLMRCILTRKDRLYSPNTSKNIYSALYQLKNYKYIDISYEDITKDKKDTNDLACIIRLTQGNPISLSGSFEFNYSATNNALNDDNSSNLGMETNLSYMDKNLFSGGEVFSTNLKLAGEINSKVFSSNSNKGLDIFNAFEAGIDFAIELPRFLAPFSTAFYSMKFHPHVTSKVGYNIQHRSYYNRSIFNLNFGYTWNTSDKRFFSFIPIEVNYVKMDITDNNYAQLIQTMDRRIQYQMSDHMVMAMRFSYVYTGQNVERRRNFNYFSFNIETAGNTLYLYSNIIGQKKEGEQYNVFSIPYSQYVRTDFSFIRYMYLSRTSSFVYKIYGGFGVPYANSNMLPYEKSFFAGGANNVRAWQLRGLGPGSSKAVSQKYDRAGDVNLGASFEYRFPMFGPMEGALFTDIGNIWTFNKILGQEGGEISKDFFKELACGGGFGLRLNLQVMIVRFDFAVKVWDPSKPLKDRFVLDDKPLKDLSVQFGIGYPF